MPGQNAKACIAGTLDVRDGKVLWVRAEEKNLSTSLRRAGGGLLVVTAA